MNLVRTLICGVALFVGAVNALAQDVKLVFSVENKGQFTMTLYPSKAPKTCAQILELASKGSYDGLRFHRALKSPRPFLVQIGDPATKNGIDDVNPYRGGMGSKLGYEESGLENVEGAVGLASDTDQKGTGTSQFYVLLDSAKFLNGKFTVFAQITKGMDVIKKIERGDRVTSVKVVRD